MRVERMGRATVLLVATLALAASPASGQRRVVRKAQFHDFEYAPYREAGTARIEGQVFLRQRGGGVVKGAGADVSLNPVTSYSKEFFDAWMAMTPLEPPDPRSNEFNQVTIADADGKFSFTNLPPGEYYATSAVFWQVGYSQQGGTVGARVRVREGETSSIVLTR